jgi:hypothetical protein
MPAEIVVKLEHRDDDGRLLPVTVAPGAATSVTYLSDNIVKRITDEYQVFLGLLDQGDKAAELEISIRPVEFWRQDNTIRESLLFRPFPIEDVALEE